MGCSQKHASLTKKRCASKTINIDRGATERAEPYRTLRYRTGGALQDAELQDAGLQNGDKRLQDGQSPTGRGATGRLEAYRTGRALQEQRTKKKEQRTKNPTNKIDSMR